MRRKSLSQGNVIYTSNCDLDFTFVEEPIEPIILDDYSLDFSVISSDPPDPEQLDEDPELEERDKESGSQPTGPGPRYTRAVVAADPVLSQVNLNHFNYYPVSFHNWNHFTFCFQYLLMLGLSCYWDTGGLVTAYFLNSFLGVLVYFANYYCSVLNHYIWNEPFSIKLVYFVVVNVPLAFIFWILRIFVTGTISSGSMGRFETLVFILLNTPCFINWVVNHSYFRKNYYLFSKECHFLARSLICKKISKAVNQISIKYLSSNPGITAQELLVILPNMQVSKLLSFVGASLLATVLFYFELDGIKFYTILVRQYYFREYLNLNSKKRRRLENKDYICDLIQRRQWDQFLDPYTLNRLLKLYLEINSRENGGLFYSNSKLQDRLLYYGSRLVVSISLASLFSPTVAPSFYLIDIVKDGHSSLSQRSKEPFTITIILIRAFTLLVYYCLLLFTPEVMLLLVGLEAGFVLLGNKYCCKLVWEILKIIREQLTGEWNLPASLLEISS